MIRMKTRTLAFSLAALTLSACGPDVVGIEVLPPRAGTCRAPTVNDPAAGRGLLDVAATEIVHGAYVADLRISALADGRVDSISRSYVLPDGVSGDVDSAASDASGEVPVGDLYMSGTDDELRQAVLENVVLLPRALAKALFDDGDLEIDDKEFKTVVVSLQATAGGLQSAVAPTASTFAIDICRGCLAVEPSDEDCDGVVVENPVCREGQDAEMFSCQSM